ncbi:MAG: hypothetical protein KDE27_14790, partial [Planctomycetes bacterium]|nr:hypothetical protein [Planctomycetota bacterium]
GRLVDTDGAPIVKAIAGISTIIEQEGGVLEIWPRPAWFYTDAYGRFLLKVVRGDRYRTQFVRKVGAPTTRREVALAADRAEVRQEFVLR